MSEKVGYKSPPRATRWRKGQSGNPRGRQKGIRNLKTELAAEMAEVVRIMEGGAPKTISKQRAVVKVLAARAIKGDSRAAALVLNLVLRLIEDEAPSHQDAPVSADDLAIVEAFLRQQSSDPGGVA